MNYQESNPFSVGERDVENLETPFHVIMTVHIVRVLKIASNGMAAMHGVNSTTARGRRKKEATSLLLSVDSLVWVQLKPRAPATARNDVNPRPRSVCLLNLNINKIKTVLLQKADHTGFG